MLSSTAFISVYNNQHILLTSRDLTYILLFFADTAHSLSRPQINISNPGLAAVLQQVRKRGFNNIYIDLIKRLEYRFTQ